MDVILLYFKRVAIAWGWHFLVTGASMLIIYYWQRERFFRFKVQPSFPPTAFVIRDLWTSLVAAFVLGVEQVTLQIYSDTGATAMYSQIEKYGWGYLIFSSIVLLVVHDVWFYWLHRFLHLPFMFKHVDSVHHRSRNPTAFTANAHHPIEALLQPLYVVVMVFVFPLHVYAILLAGHIDRFLNMAGHLGYEFMPAGWTKHPLSRHYLTVTYHNMHHEFPDANFGLYFSFWDNFFGTRHSSYLEKFAAVCKRRDEYRQKSEQDQSSAA